MRLHHIGLSVQNLGKSIKFYTENFSFKKTSTFTKPDWDGEAVMLESDNLTLEIFGFDDYKTNHDDYSNLKTIGIKHFCFAVDSVEKKYQELKSKGVDIDTPQKGTACATYCFLRDPDGISIEIYQK